MQVGYLPRTDGSWGWYVSLHPPPIHPVLGKTGATFSEWQVRTLNWRAKSGVTSFLIEPVGQWDVDLGGAGVGCRYLEWMAEWTSVPSVKEKLLLPTFYLPTLVT